MELSLLGFYCIKSSSFTPSSCWQHHYSSISSELKVGPIAKSCFKIFMEWVKPQKFPLKIFSICLCTSCCPTLQANKSKYQKALLHLFWGVKSISFSVKRSIFFNILLWNLQVLLRVQAFLAQLSTSNDIQQHLQSKHLSTFLLHNC